MMKCAIFCRKAETDDELAACMDIRHKVFVVEQGLFAGTDHDEHDQDALHLAAFSSGRIIGTVRLFKEDGDIWWGGRLAVLKRYRGRAGRELVQAAVAMAKSLGAAGFYAYIQKENLNFFKTIGWRQKGGELILHGRPHMLVEADLRG